MKKKRIKKIQYGLKLDFPKEGDYVLGASNAIGGTILQANGQWNEFLPIEEYQALGVESMACTAFGTLSACEMLIKKQFGNEENFSDRWLAWSAGITQQGASPHTTAEYLRKLGTPFQHLWDYTPDINTWDKFYETPPAKLVDYAKENFLNRYNFKHEYTPTSVESIKTALQFSPIGISVFAWVQNEEGIYYKPKGTTDNHWVVCCGYDDNKKAWKIFDSYEQNLKLYSFDSEITIAKRFFIEKKTKKLGFWKWLLALFF